MFGGGTSLQLFRIRGIRVGVHPTWFLILFLFIWWLQDSFEDAIITPDQGFIAAVIAAFLFFGSIVLHELGHAFAARREGIGVGGIDLFFFGGFMRAMRDSETPGEEFRVAAAGPAVTLLLTLVFGGVGFALLGDTLLDAATFSFASGTLVEVMVAFTALANAGAVRAEHGPGVPARRRPDHARGRLAAHRRPAQGDRASPPTSARASRC